ncbi:MAG: AmmeMemoRadiSam system protein A [Planctomycetota bacterium]|nr:MAG: AmmeMemoRadiSam system protein A [Planctomycetota bacterium]
MHMRLAERVASMMTRLSTKDRETLLQVALAAIRESVSSREGRAIEIDARDYAPSLQEHRAAFVTLHNSGRLRGCRGSVSADESLVVCTARSARAAALFDERFHPVTEAEIRELQIHVSILGEPEEIPVAAERELLEFLQPGVHGLIVRAAGKEALFLPSVWQKLPDPAEFVQHLKSKAGLSPTLQYADTVWRCFTVDEFEGYASEICAFDDEDQTSRA